MPDWVQGFLTGVSPAVAIILLIVWFPEKVEKWSALIWLAGSWFVRSAHKRYVKHSLQGQVNDFVRRLRSDIPDLGQDKLKIQWVDPSVQRTSFLAKDELVLRLRRDDPEHVNFVHAAYLFVSGALLRKPKRYLSPSQREAVDLFVCARILEEEHPSVVGVFLDEYLHPKTEKPKSRVGELLDDFGIMDEAGLFYPILVQELTYLGDKVFGRRRDERVRVEVNTLFEFLNSFARREVGDTEGDLDHHGNYCRFGLVIVGRSLKLRMEGIRPYVRIIRKKLLPANTETIYLLSQRNNLSRIEAVASSVSEAYDTVRIVKYRGRLRFPDGPRNVKQALVVLRKKQIPVIQTSE